MPNFDRSYFDKITFNLTEYAERDIVAVHVWKVHKNCRVIRVPIAWLESGDCWRMIYEEAIKKWDDMEDKKGECPHCKQPRRNWERMNLGRKFCGYCGERLEGVK